ncbi:MAG: hypothetical protein II097_03300, partial [Bacteroidales bacterium]|nr:hypothetical protein [Bacteroidales bacterium]
PNQFRFIGGKISQLAEKTSGETWVKLSWLFRAYREKDIKRHKAKEKTPFDDRRNLKIPQYCSK